MDLVQASDSKNVRKPSLVGVLTRTLFLGSLFAFILMGVFLNIYGSYILQTITNERLNYILTTQANNSAQLLWDFETEKLETTLRNIVEDRNISAAKVTEMLGDQESPVAEFNWPEDKEYSRVLAQEIVYATEGNAPRKLGVLRIALDYQSVETQIRNILWVTGGMLGVVFIVLGITIYFVLRRAINPITALSDSLVKADYFSHTIKRPHSSTKEINDLFDALITMQHIMQRQTSEIKEQKVMLDTIFEKMPLGVYVEDMQSAGNLVVVNGMFKMEFGLYNSSCTDTTIDRLLGEKDAEFLGSMNKICVQERRVVIEKEHVTGTHMPFVAHILKAPILDEKGNVSLIITMIEDVTDQVEARTDLIIAKEAAERANQAKSEFLANMSHELRTPMNSIMGLTGIVIEDGGHSAEHEEMLTTVMRSSGILLNIVNDILDLSKIEAGGIRLENIEFDLQDTLGAVFDTLRPLASSKSLVFSVSHTGELAHMVQGDPTRISRILTNLGSNAIKFTPKGAVRIDVTYEYVSPQIMNLICVVSDTGIGIPQDKLEHVFDKFSQADDSISRKFGGTGLGLAITKQLVTLMRGEISVQSQVGEGSVFRVKIPIRILQDFTRAETKNETRKTVSQDSERMEIKKAKVLIAEDQKMNQMLIVKILQRLGVTDYKIAEDGALAVEAFLNDAPYDLVIMDCHMPNMTGYEASRSIRHYERENPQLKPAPIIAMTADAMVGTREKCLEAGMDDYISKPVNAKLFAQMLERWFIL